MHGTASIYTQICFCFPVPASSSHATIIETLRNGLQRLATSFPWAAGQVVGEFSGKGSSEILKIKAFGKTPPLVVKDLRNDPSIPSMDALRRANFPFHMLDESVIAPRNTIPTTEETKLEWPVFALQANFITGGLVLTVVGHHSAMDMIGQGQLIHLLSKACRNEPFTIEELSSGNLERGTLISLLDDSYTPGPELNRQIAKLPLPTNNSPSTPSKSSWTYISFSPASLVSLKSLATQTVPSGYVSTDDTLSAFVWQSIMRARLPRLSPTQEATLTRAVDVRESLDIPGTYPGLMQNLNYHTSAIQKLVEEPLGVVASQLRSALEPKAIAYQTRALATLLDRAPPDTVISFTDSLDLSIDFMLSSWAKLNCYEFDFDLGLGKPESVRRPQFVPVESLGYLMPKARDGEITLAICLRDEDMERLKADAEFGKYGRWID
ncbi:putative trichothecene 3-O-acetyltransferase [Marasmius fiardii PR-910]|nr:putative trichothecene 3-O-acetyltransferase [Marasmius fiardii PR-910]